ncbi:hypothetical protein [Microbacterium esteraromaticum]|uniref:hypothetical protein n=1 Tax=Microbacterium esteraromaticum TaxID=57043 RepID=UPI0015F3B54D|nr:hypothetical protein [Microbacterium esteraromaticum]
MYEHPYLTYQVSAVEIERIAQAAERRRIVAENPSRIVAREGLLTRMLRRAAPAKQNRPVAPAEAPCVTGARCVPLEA